MGRWLLLAAAVGLLVLGAVGARVWSGWMAQGAALARQHAAFAVSHPGWSFPATVVAVAPQRAAVTPKRWAAEARLRGFTDVVPESLPPLVLARLMGPDAERRTHFPLERAPKHLLDAILASEDRDFRTHAGVDLRSLGRALFRNFKKGGYAQGGSTVSMQVVRALNQRTEKRLARKLEEMALAMGLDRELGKDGVLQMYVDAPYLGQDGPVSVCGFEEAAQFYFGVGAEALSLSQAATLVGLLPAPGAFNPRVSLQKATARRNLVLDAMAETFGYDVTAAKTEPLELAAIPVQPLERFPSYVQAVRAELERLLPPSVVYGAGLTVEVALDPVMQGEAEALFPEKLARYEALVGRKKGGPLEAAGVAVDTQTGAIRALYGGLESTSTGFSRATQARRQPGSSFKPLVYALAFAQRAADGSPRFTAASTEPNSPRVFKTPQGDWRPSNVSGESSVTASLAQGLTWSQNIATASLLEELGGPGPLIALAGRMGIDTKTFPAEYGLALGQAEVTPLEMAVVNATIANGGLRVDPRTVVRVVDATGTVRLEPPVARERVLPEDAAVLTRELMRLVVEAGTGGAIRGADGEAGYPGPAIGKTGTTDSEKDLWFVGATPVHAMVVWLGYDQPERVGAAAADLAAPLWGWWMGRSTKVDLDPASPTKRPEFSGPKLARQPICTISGLLPREGCKAIMAPFFPGTAPKKTCALEHDETYAPEAHESLWKRRAREAEEARQLHEQTGAPAL